MKRASKGKEKASDNDTELSEYKCVMCWRLLSVDEHNSGEVCLSCYEKTQLPEEDTD